VIFFLNSTYLFNFCSQTTANLVKTSHGNLQFWLSGLRTETHIENSPAMWMVAITSIRYHW